MISPGQSGRLNAVDAMARALRTCVDGFVGPVHVHIAPEARRRWEASNPGADSYALPADHWRDESYRILARAALVSLNDVARPAISLTRSMIEAGASEIASWGGGSRGASPEDRARQVFETMLAAYEPGSHE